MTLSTLIFSGLLSVAQWPLDQPRLPGPYPFNHGHHGREIDHIDRIVLAKFVTRKATDPVMQRRTITGNDKPTMFLDTFEVMGDDGKALDSSEKLNVIVGGFAMPSQPPEPGKTYLLATKAPAGGVAGMFVTPQGNEPVYWVHVDRDVVSGLVCYPLAKLTRSRAEDGTEDLTGTILLSLIEPIREAKSANEMAVPISMMETFDLKYYHDPERFGSGIAGQKAADWIRDHFWPRLAEAVKGKPMEVKLEAFGMLAAYPGAKSTEYGRELFEYVLKQIHTTRKIPTARYNLIGNAYIDADRIIAEADRMPWNVRKSFIGSLSRPLSERSVAVLISWLDKADGTLAHFLLDKLASWAKRKDLEPQIAEKYKDGHPVILNREVLTEIWKRNPPPLHKRGG